MNEPEKIEKDENRNKKQLQLVLVTSTDLS